VVACLYYLAPPKDQVGKKFNSAKWRDVNSVTVGIIQETLKEHGTKTVILRIITWFFGGLT
jgi:hypothetical protein